MISTFRGLIAAAAVSAAAVFSVSEAQAAGVPALGDSLVGNYDIENGWGGTHGLWFSNLFASKPAGETPTKQWSLIDGSGSLSFDGSTLLVSGSTKNNGDENLLMDFAFELSFKQVGGQAPYCQNNCPISAGAAANMHYFDYVSATLTGGGDITGFSATLTEKDKDFQFGHEGIGYDDDFGGSTWFYMTLTGETVFGDYTLKSSNGDLNIQAALVPLPAAAWFLIAGMGALGVAGRRKKAA